MARQPKKTTPNDALAQVHVPAREEPARMPALSAVPPAPAPAQKAPSVAAEILISAMNRLDRLDDEIRELNRAKSDVYAELKAQGFTVPVVRQVLKERRVDPILRQEKQQIFDAYWDAVGGSQAATEGEERAA
jgi:uncharacterized protein (UPF0335 family)